MSTAQSSLSIAFEEQSSDRVVFRRSGSSKALGGLLYFVVWQLVGAMIALCAGLVTYGLLEEEFKFRRIITIPSIIIVVGLILWGFLSWAIRSFRRRAYEEYVFTPASIEYSRRRSRSVWSLGDIDGVCLADGGFRIAFDLKSGRRAKLDASIASAVQVLPVLDQWLFPELLRIHESAMAAGQVIVVRDLGIRAFLVWVDAIVALLLGLASAFTVFHALEAKYILSAATIRARQAFRGFRGGLRISRDGVISMKDGTLVEWNQITDTELDKAGLRIFSSRRSPIAVTSFATHFFELCVMLRNRGLLESGSLSR